VSTLLDSFERLVLMSGRQFTKRNEKMLISFFRFCKEIEPPPGDDSKEDVVAESTSTVAPGTFQEQLVQAIRDASEMEGGASSSGTESTTVEDVQDMANFRWNMLKLMEKVGELYMKEKERSEAFASEVSNVSRSV
jgi:hypothetical protein